ncbi:MAG: hypothetical protein GZ087_15570 [Flavobacterium sp.]|nr:hypothetical protein [Flavobacterium sp.]
MKNILFLFISIFFFSCQQKENKNASVKVLKSIPTMKSKEENKQFGDTIFMNYRNEKHLFTAEGFLDSIDSRIYVKFKNEYSGQLKAKIIPTTGKGNIRFNQIIFPDKTSDGPFGMDLKIHLKQKGNYIIVIGHSLMANNPFSGKFKVQLENKKE